MRVEVKGEQGLGELAEECKQQRGCGEKGTCAHCRSDCKLVQPLWETAGRFLEKLRLELSYDPALTLLDLYLRNTKPRT